MAAELNRRQFDTLSQQQRANPARSVELVRSQAKRRDTQLVKVHRQFADSLHRIQVQRQASFAATAG